MVKISRYYHYQGEYSRKRNFESLSNIFLLMGGMFTFMGFALFAFTSSEFPIAFGFFAFTNSVLNIGLFIGAGVLVILGIVFRIRASKMEDEKPVQRQIRYTKVSPKTQVVELLCPNCKAPLPNKPPCKCEYCGRLIRNL